MNNDLYVWGVSLVDKFREGCWRVYLNALQLNSNALFVFDGAMLGLGELVWQSHIL